MIHLLRIALQNDTSSFQQMEACTKLNITHLEIHGSHLLKNINQNAVIVI